MKRRRSNLFLYLLLNIIVSAATTLTVLAVWDSSRPLEIAAFAPLPTLPVASGAARATPAPTIALQLPSPIPISTLPPTSQPVIEINGVIAVGDVQQEVVLLKRLGAGSIRMAGWQLQGDQANTYTFPEQPDLVLYEGGAVQLFSRPGTDTATEIYWNRAEAAWRSGETIRLLDPQGNLRATYLVP